MPYLLLKGVTFVFNNTMGDSICQSLTQEVAMIKWQKTAAILSTPKLSQQKLFPPPALSEYSSAQPIAWGHGLSIPR